MEVSTPDKCIGARREVGHRRIVWDHDGGLGQRLDLLVMEWMSVLLEIAVPQ